jgi:hypothetical protein
MSHLLAGRRRMILSRGRMMTLRREGTPPLSVDLIGFPRGFRPDEIKGGVVQGDQQVEILTDELEDAGWPDAPERPDRLMFDGTTTTVQGARPVYDGALRIGWSLWVRGS